METTNNTLAATTTALIGRSLNSMSKLGRQDTMLIAKIGDNLADGYKGAGKVIAKINRDRQVVGFTYEQDLNESEYPYGVCEDECEVKGDVLEIAMRASCYELIASDECMSADKCRVANQFFGGK